MNRINIFATPWKAGVQNNPYFQWILDSRLRGKDCFAPLAIPSCHSFLTILCAALILLSGHTTHAGGERVWELAGYPELSRGELQQAVLSERGELLAGLATEKIDTDAVGLIWSAVRADDGTLYLGTAYDGGIYRVDGNRAHLIATTDNLVVTDMIIDEAGNLLAATVPSPVVWRIATPQKIDPKAPVKAEALITLPDNEDAGTMIWSLAEDRRTNTLYMGTGPEGQLWAAGKDHRPTLYLETEEKHLLDVLPHDGGLYVGTSPGALLLNVTAPGVSFALADFDGTEAKSIARLRDGALAVAVNHFVYPRKAPTSASSTATSAANLAEAVSSALKKGASGTKTSSQDKGYLFRVAPEGRQEQLLEKAGTHITAVAVSDDDTIWAAMGDEGKIFSVTPDRIVFEAADLAEREVMCLLADDTLSFAGTGDTGAAYRFSSKNIEPVYLSPVLDAGTVAVFGRTRWIASGAVEVSARTGNTVTPDGNWTDWSVPFAGGESPAVQNARYIQLRFRWQTPDAVLLQSELFYRPANRRAVITSFDPDSPFRDSSGASKGEAGTSERTVTLRPDKLNKKELSLSWKVDNPDNDQLQYRLYCKPVDKTLWMPVFKEDERYTQTRYTFATDNVPEGRYHFKLTAVDVIDNPEDEVLDDEMISVPVDIDNHPPEITSLEFATQSGEVSGMVTDSYSPVAAIDYAVDGGLWLPVAASDGLLDAPKESFRFRIMPRLAMGAHVIAVRAVDRQGNMTVREIHTEITQ
ncbi:MAG: hypothetical protein JXX14_23435 [Deltaproteobacteria bacterium]|nr:hypothetical protein [Deltaproteobacteria bacterium]